MVHSAKWANLNFFFLNSFLAGHGRRPKLELGHKGTRRKSTPALVGLLGERFSGSGDQIGKAAKGRAGGHMSAAYTKIRAFQLLELLWL
jgi:hypothetical protein